MYFSGWCGILFVVWRPTEITVRWWPIGLRWEVPESERERLHSLFVALGDESALQTQAVDPATVRLVVESTRARVRCTLVELGPDAAAAPSLEFLRRACHDYLDVMGPSSSLCSSMCMSRCTNAVVHLRATFAMVAEFIGREYRLRSATRLAQTIQVSDLRIQKGN